MNAKIALITGGYTGEAEVSLKSAAFVHGHIDRTRYEVYQIVITDTSWYYISRYGQRYEVEKKDFSLEVGDRTVYFDMAFIMLHGSPGEDGKIQGYFDMIGLRYTGCDALTSALTMNKAYTKAILQGLHPQLHLAASVYLNEDNRRKAASLVEASLRFPVFVKPNGGGSSIGMSKVDKLAELVVATEKAFHTQNAGKQVLVEEFVSGREFSVGVYQEKGVVKVLPSTEVKTSRPFFDFEAKYTPGLTEEITPAALSTAQQELVEELVKAVYIRLNCRGLVRVDYFLEAESDRFFFIEINTVPGQTAQSFVPQQIRAANLKEGDFYTMLLEEALNA